jgi:hypothetical protein
MSLLPTNARRFTSELRVSFWRLAVSGMKSLIPRRPAGDHAEEPYRALIRRARSDAGQPINTKPYRAIAYVQNGRAERAIIGKPYSMKADETVVAIFECQSGLFLIYTQNRRQNEIIGPYLASRITSAEVFGDD